MANKRFNQITRVVTSFDSNDVLPVGNSTLGDGKMTGDTLLELTAQNALAGNVAPAFDPTRDNTNPYKAGESVVYEGKTYMFKVDHYGAWDAGDVENSLSQLAQVFSDGGLSNPSSLTKVKTRMMAFDVSKPFAVNISKPLRNSGGHYEIGYILSADYDSIGCYSDSSSADYSVLVTVLAGNGFRNGDVVDLSYLYPTAKAIGFEILEYDSSNNIIANRAIDFASQEVLPVEVKADKSVQDAFAKSYCYVSFIGDGQNNVAKRITPEIEQGVKYRLVGRTVWNIDQNTSGGAYNIFRLSYVLNGTTTYLINKLLANGASYNGVDLLDKDFEFMIPVGAQNVVFALRASAGEVVNFLLAKKDYYEKIDQTRQIDFENISTIPASWVGHTYESLLFDYAGDAHKLYRFEVTSASDTPLTNVNKMYLRIVKADNTYQTIIPSSSDSWVYEGAFDVRFKKVEIKFESVTSAISYNIKVTQKSVYDFVYKNKTDINANLAKIDNLEKNVLDDDFTITGNGNTAVNIDLTDAVVKGKYYQFKLAKTYWTVAQNTNAYTVYAFRLYTTLNNVNTDIAIATIGAGESVMDRELEHSYSVLVPEGATLKLSVRASNLEELKFSLDHDVLGLADILNMYRDVDFMPKIGMLKKKTPFSGVGAGVNTPVVLLWFSDIHGDIENLKRIVKFKTYYSRYIDDVLNTGDSVPDNLTNYNDYYAPMLAAGADKMLVAIGNHDVTHANVSFKGWAGLDTILSIYDKFVGAMDVSGVVRTSGKNYYYKDYSGASSCKNVRLIVLDSCIQSASLEASGSGVSPTETLNYMASQLSWLEGVLSDAVTNNKAVVIATHDVGVEDELPSTSGFTALRNLSLDVTANMSEDILDAVDTFIGNGGEFVCWLAGHRHEDHVTKVQGHSSQMVIHVNTASSRSYGSSASSLYRTGYDGEQPITRATDAFDVIGFDTYNKLVKIVRVGCNVDSYGRPINMVAIDYVTGKIVSSIDDM